MSTVSSLTSPKSIVDFTSSYSTSSTLLTLQTQTPSSRPSFDESAQAATSSPAHRGSVGDDVFPDTLLEITYPTAWLRAVISNCFKSAESKQALNQLRVKPPTNPNMCTALKKTIDLIEEFLTSQKPPENILETIKENAKEALTTLRITSGFQLYATPSHRPRLLESPCSHNS